MSEHTMGTGNGVTGNGIVQFDDAVTFVTPVGTDFKAVAIGTGANLEALPAYFTDPLLQTGNMPGLAISAFNNRAIRQGTFVASSLCLWMSGILNQYIPDDGSQINWVANFQSAISSLITASLPSTGVYLPIAGSPPGSPMTGHIRFSPGISTILANNTWRFSLDTSATPRGLLLLGSDNNVYLNDGSAAYVYLHGTPCADNNIYWSGRDTGGTPRPLIGMRNDNSVHIASGATGDIYFDEVNATHHAGNINMANNKFINSNDTGGTAHTMLGINNGNSALICVNYPWDVNIYGNPIYLRNATSALSTFQVSGATSMLGGGRAYIPGGNDPFTVACDNGYYARVQYNIYGVRLWTAGALSNACFAIADESAHSVRWQIDTNGNITVTASETINGNLYVNNGVSISGGTSVGGGLTVYNGLYVPSGNVTFSGSLTVAGNITTNNSLFFANGLQVYNNSNYFYVANGNGVHAPYLYSRGDIGAAGNVWITGQVQAGYVISTGDVHSNGNTTSGNGVYGNYVQSNGDMRLAGCFYLNGLQVCNSNGLFHIANCGMVCAGVANLWTDVYISGNLNSYNWNNVYVVRSIYGDNQGACGWWGDAWNVVISYAYSTSSDERGKTNIAPLPSGCLDAVRSIVPKSFNLKEPERRNVPPPMSGRDPEALEAEAEMDAMRKRTYWGFIAQDVGRVMKEAGHDFGGHLVSSKGEQAISIVDMLAVLWAAVRELSDEVRQLKAA